MIPFCQTETRFGFSPRWQIAAGGCLCAAVTAYAYAVDPAQGGYPSCFLYQTTGFYCAGCGATRALHALLHGRLLEALHDNVLFVALLPIFLVLAGIYLGKTWGRNKWPDVTLPPTVLLRGGFDIVALMVAFMVLRNLPGTPFDLLRPLAGS